MKKLRIDIKQHLRQEKALRDRAYEKRPLTGAQRALYGRARKDASERLNDLVFFLEVLPEEQLEQIFNAKKMRPFFEALFNLEIRAGSRKEYLEIKESKEFRQKRQRLLALSAQVLSLIGEGNFVYALLPEYLKPYLTYGYPPTRNFEAILSHSLHDPEANSSELE